MSGAAQASVYFRRASHGDALGIATTKVRSWQAAYRGLIPQAYLDRLNPDEVALRAEKWISESVQEHHWVYEDSGSIGGWACTTMPARDSELNDETGEVVAIYLLPEFWGQGIGDRLFQLCVQGLIEQGATSIILWMLEGNEQAHRFYERQGFTHDGQRKSLDLGGDVPLWEVRYLLQLTL